MSGPTVVLLIVGVALGVVFGLLPSALDRAADPGRVGLRPGSHGAPAALWAHLIRRLFRRGQRRRLVLVPFVLVLQLTAGGLRVLAVVVRLADLVAERAARHAEEYTDPDS